MKRLTDISGFLSGLGSTRTIVMHSGCAEPRLLARQLANHAHEVLGTRLITLMTMGDAPYLDADRASYLDIQTFFPGRAIRSAFNAGLVRPLRYPLSAIPALFTRRAIQVDAIFLQVSPPDVTGHVSLGVSLDYMREVIDQTPVILAEINPQMPHTSGRTRVHVSQIDWFVDAEGGPQQVAPGTGDPIDDLIARNVAGIVRDGAVLQIGMGALPDRVLSKLGHAKHLGLHSGIVTDTVRPLIESGVIDNTTKQAHAGVSITTMAAGTQSFYDFLHRNAAIEFHGCAYTHGASVV